MSQHDEFRVLEQLLAVARDQLRATNRQVELSQRIDRELQDQGKILQQIADDLAPEPHTQSVVNVFSGENMADNVLVLNVGQTSIDTLSPRLADGTPSGGTVHSVSVNFSDPSATAQVQADNTILFTGVAASASPVSGTSVLAVTDTDGAESQWTVPFTVQVNAPPPPSQLTQSVANVFSAPTP